MAIAAGSTPLPTDFFPSYVSNGTSITIDIADLSGLTAAEADAATGNGCEVVDKLTRTAYSKIQAAAEGDRPQNFVIEEGGVQPVDSSSYRQDLTINTLRSLDSSTTNVVQEPAV